MVCGVYKITCGATGDFYIGYSKDIEKRWKGHLGVMKGVVNGTRGTNQPGTSTPKILELCYLHGIETFSLDVLEECPEADLRGREYFWISQLKPTINSRFDRCVRWNGFPSKPRWESSAEGNLFRDLASQLVKAGYICEYDWHISKKIAIKWSDGEESTYSSVFEAIASLKAALRILEIQSGSQIKKAC